MKKVLVLGSNSFTGSHFINYLLEHTDTEIIGISRSSEYNSILLPYIYKKNKSDRFTFFQLDINKDFEKIKDIINKKKPDVVINYSAQGEVRNSWNWPEQWFETNCMSVVKLGNFLKDKPFLKKYVSISTPEVYGSTEKNIIENFNFYPSTPYAASKLSGDLFLFTLFKKQNFPVVMTRSANVYGIHQQLYRIIPRTIIYLKLGKKIQLHGDGKAVRSFIHVRDVADATWKIITKGNNGAVYHLSPEENEISIKELVKMICDMMDFDFETSVEMINENFGQDAMYSLNSEKIRKELSWQDKISLKEGIKEMITWIEDNFDEIKNMPLDYIHKE
jgi:dTDP-glucose 4,6-dehydratase